MAAAAASPAAAIAAVSAVAAAADAALAFSLPSCWDAAEIMLNQYHAIIAAHTAAKIKLAERKGATARRVCACACV